ncbi:MAG: hypothetical protein ACE5LU_13260, partial [Anaerolineae bacterium]
MELLRFSLLILLIFPTACVPATTAPPTATLPPTETPLPATTLTSMSTPTFTPPPTATLTPTASTGQSDQLRRIPSPDGRWTAVLNETAGSLDLENPTGETVTIFPPRSTVDTAEWSPDSRHLLVVRTNWLPPQPDVGVQATGPAEIWRVRIEDGESGSPALVFRPTPPHGKEKRDIAGPSQIVLGRWSPDGRHILFWHGILSASILADGMPMRVLNVETG